MDPLEETSKKNCEKKRCTICDVLCKDTWAYNRHLLTAKHELNEERAKMSNPPQSGLCCEKCDYTTYSRTRYKLHLNTKKHKSINRNEQEMSKIPPNGYCCEKCNYTTTDHISYKLHLTTKKHKSIEQNEQEPNNQKISCSICRYNTFKKANYDRHMQSIKHLEKCKKKGPENTEESNNENIPENELLNSDDPTHNMMKMFMQNQEFQTKMLEFMMQTQNTMKLMTNNMNNVTNNNTNTNNNNTNCNNTTNNTANINIFLNERCKDAINMTDFLKTIRYTAETLKYMERNGFANTITKLFTEKLQELSLYERPIHCTDLKREVMYIKDNNEWKKNAEENKTMRDKMVDKYIPIMEKDNRIAFSQYYRDHPEYNEIGHPEYESFFTLAREVNNGRDKESNDIKIIKNICKNTYLSRDAIKDS